MKFWPWLGESRRGRSRGASSAWTLTLFVHLIVFVVSFWSTNMSTIAISPAVIVVDVGTVDPRERHSMVFDTFAGLAPGQALELVSDHNPEPLLEEFVAELPDGFWWRREKGHLNLWRVLIGKPATALD